MIAALKKLYEHHAEDCFRQQSWRAIRAGVSNISSWRASGMRRPRRLELMQTAARQSRDEAARPPPET